MPAIYDAIGKTYQSTRRPDPRIATLIQDAIPAGASVLNVGAGTGSYEPTSRGVIALEPSRTMIAQRGAAAAPAICGVAEYLPLPSKSVDVVLGVLTLHHWRDLMRGINECRRVARARLVFLTWDPLAQPFWLLSEYFPEIVERDRAIFPAMSTLQRMLDSVQIIAVPVPHDCIDGFLGAFWRRPEAYLDPNVRNGISAFASITNINEPLARLESAVDSGAWYQQHRNLLELESLDIGYRLVVVDL